MANLTAIPTTEGISILNSSLRDSVQKFVLVGVKSSTNEELEGLIANSEDVKYEDIQKFIFYTNTIESAYFDDEKTLTFETLLPVEDDLEQYTFGIGLVTTNSKLVCLTPTPKIPLIKGIGGTFVVKIAVKGAAGEIVFKSSEYVTPSELLNHKANVLRPVVANATAYFDLTTKLIDKGVISA